MTVMFIMHVVSIFLIIFMVMLLVLFCVLLSIIIIVFLIRLRMLVFSLEDIAMNIIVANDTNGSTSVIHAF